MYKAALFLVPVFLLTSAIGFAETPLCESEEIGARLAENRRRIVDGESLSMDEELLNCLYADRKEYLDQTLPVDSRAEMEVLVQRFTHLNDILQTLVAANDNVFTKETARLLGAYQHMAVRVVFLSNDFVGTLDPEASDYAVRLRGMRQGYIGVANTLLGNLFHLYVEDPTPDVRTIMVENLRSFGSEVMPLLPEDIRSQMYAFIDSSIAPDVPEERREGFQETYALLRTKES